MIITIGLAVVGTARGEDAAGDGSAHDDTVAPVAEAHAGDVGHAEHAEHDEPAVIVAGRAVAAMVFEPEHPELLGGGGLAVERPLPHHLAMEIAVSGTTGKEARELPMELILQRTWAVSALEPYVGLGPTVVVRTALEEHHTDVRVGGAAVVGTHLWASRHWGLLLEADGVLTGPERPGHATLTSELVTGVVGRWD